MARRKKHFPCGHQGMGRFCHHCEANRQAHGHQSDQDFSESSVSHPKTEVYSSMDGRFSVSLLPLNGDAMVNKAIHTLSRIFDYGDHYSCFGGKRINRCRNIISVPVGTHYRIIIRQQDDGQLVPYEIMTHAKYNRYLRVDNCYRQCGTL